MYKNLLLRTQATLETDAGLQAALLHEADTLRNRALELQRARPASYTIPEGTVVTPGPPPPRPASAASWGSRRPDQLGLRGHCYHRRGEGPSQDQGHASRLRADGDCEWQ